VLLYGHLDKQPEMVGWAAGYGPWIPLLEGDKLYGRGGADDGYAMFGALSALLALREQGAPHAHCVVLIEACEESGSYDLPYYIDHLAQRIGSPALVVCLDSGCGNYDQLWMTTSLRGIASGTLAVQVLDEGVHSGDASGVVPSSFRILRQLLSRLEDAETGTVRPAELYAQVPSERVAQARRAAAALGDTVYTKFPLMPGMSPMSEDLTDLVLNRTWRPQLAVIGIDGLPDPLNAGNVLLPRLSPSSACGCRRLWIRRRWAIAFAGCWRRTRPMGRGSTMSPDRVPLGGTPRRCRPGSSGHCSTLPKPPLARRRLIWARVAAFRSWRCSARNSRRRSLS